MKVKSNEQTTEAAKLDQTTIEYYFLYFEKQATEKLINHLSKSNKREDHYVYGFVGDEPALSEKELARINHILTSRDSDMIYYSNIVTNSDFRSQYPSIEFKTPNL